MGFPSQIGDGQRFESEGTDATTSLGTLITAGTGNAKGSYAQLVAATGFAGQGLIICAGGSSSTTADYLFDIAIGPGGSEQILIPNLYYRASFGINSFLPIGIPNGVRVAARCQASVNSATLKVAAFIMSQTFLSGEDYQIVDAIGVVAASSTGTTITASGTANVKGSYTQLIASTARPYRLAVLSLRPITAASFLVDVAVGAGGSEQIVLPNVNISGVNSGFNTPLIIPFGVKAGSRIAVRCQASTGGGATMIAHMLGIA